MEKLQSYSFDIKSSGIYFTLNCSDDKIKCITLNYGIAEKSVDVPVKFQHAAERLISSLYHYTGHNLSDYDFDSFSTNEMKIYSALMGIPAGKVISYGNLAHIAGMPRGGRYAGNLMAKNRFPILIPCHRVIKSDLTPGNFSAGNGINMKILLLKMEGIVLENGKIDASYLFNSAGKNY